MKKLGVKYTFDENLLTVKFRSGGVGLLVIEDHLHIINKTHSYTYTTYGNSAYFDKKFPDNRFNHRAKQYFSYQYANKAFTLDEIYEHNRRELNERLSNGLLLRDYLKEYSGKTILVKLYDYSE